MTCKPQTITLRNADDLHAFVQQYQPSKEVFTQIIHKWVGIIAFPCAFEDVDAMLDEFKRLMSLGKSRPIYMGVKLTVDTHDDTPAQH
jgi:hypothetical protein